MCREMAVFSRALQFLRRIAGSSSGAVPVSPTDMLGECPRCGRCCDASVRECPVDGSPIKRSSSMPLVLDGKDHTFLEDGDQVTITAWATTSTGTRLGLGEVIGTIKPA